MTSTSDLEDRLIEAIHDPSIEIEMLAHEVAASEDAQTYLVETLQTLATLSPRHPAIDRAALLLEHAIAIAAEQGIEATAEQEAGATSAATRGSGDDPER